MKIHRIAIENLASLRGRQPDLELTGGELEDVGLIAITGATGAGKTTVLDAVCLALFDRTPRLRGRGQDPRELLTRGAAQARAVVDLTLDDGTRWCCEWSVHRAHNKPDGALQPARQRITDGTTGEILADGKRDVQALVESHLGLSFEQFTGVILLAQGAFATFLESSDTERSALLERLTGTEIYSRLGRAAFERHKALREEVEAEESRWRELEPLDAARRSALEQEIDELEPSLVRLEAHQAALEQRLAWLERLDQLEKRAADADAVLEQALARSADAEPDRRRARQAEQAMSLAAPLDAADAASERAEAAGAALEAAREEKDRADETALHARRRLDAALARLEAERQAAVRRLEELEPLEAATPEKRTELRDLRRDAESQEQTRRRRADELERSRRSAERLAEEAEEAEGVASRIGDERRRLEELLVDLGSRRRNALGQVSREALVARDLRLDRAQQVRRELENLDPERLREAVAGGELAEARARTHREAAASLAAASRRELEHEEKMLRLAERGAELARHRRDLEPGEPCPLCGSLEHPRMSMEVADEELDALREAEEKIASLRAEQRRATEDLETADAEIRKAENERQRAEQRLEEALRVQSDLTSSWLTLRLQLIDLPPEPFEIELRTLAAQQQETREQLETLAAFDAEEKELRERLETVSRELGEAERDLAVKAERAAEASRRLESARLADEDAEEKRVELWRVWFARASELAEACRLEAPATLEVAEPGGDPPDDAFERRLDAARAAYEQARRLAERLEALAANSRSRAGDRATPAGEAVGESEADRHEATKDQVTDLDELAAMLDGALHKDDEARQRRRLAADRLERATAAATSEARRRDETRQALDRELRDSPFDDAAHLRRALLPRGELEALRRRLLDLELEAERRRTERKRQHEELEDHRRDGGGTVDLDLEDTAEPADGADPRARLGETLRETRARLRRATDRKLTLRVELQRDEERRESRRSLETKLGALRATRDRAARLAALIGQKDGGKFRRFAQQLNLDQLLGLANLRLERLAPRYALARLGSGLELEVIDRDMADERRPTSTLSGGESFLVSLALALGLADLRRGQLRLGTLFLDEGFGSLDEDTLETALATLEQLQAEQSTQILIISHVGALQERIAHRISVEKMGGGRSRLRLITGRMEVS